MIEAIAQNRFSCQQQKITGVRKQDAPRSGSGETHYRCVRARALHFGLSCPSLRHSQRKQKAVFVVFCQIYPWYPHNPWSNYFCFSSQSF